MKLATWQPNFSSKLCWIQNNMLTVCFYDKCIAHIWKYFHCVFVLSFWHTRAAVVGVVTNVVTEKLLKYALPSTAQMVKSSWCSSTQYIKESFLSEIMHSHGIWDRRTEVASEAVAAATPGGAREEAAQLQWAHGSRGP